MLLFTWSQVLTPPASHHLSVTVHWQSETCDFAYYCKGFMVKGSGTGWEGKKRKEGRCLRLMGGSLAPRT